VEMQSDTESNAKRDEALPAKRQKHSKCVVYRVCVCVCVYVYVYV
jgi:hypothetical protein